MTEAQQFWYDAGFKAGVESVKAWIEINSASDFPSDNKNHLVAFQRKNGTRYTVKAVYVTKHHIHEVDFLDEESWEDKFLSEYDSEKDLWWVKPNWYETNCACEYGHLITDKAIAYFPIPPIPEREPTDDR